MSTKKQTTTTTSTSKPKYYIVMDSDEDIICQGNWDEIKKALEKIMEGNDDDENLKMLRDIKLYELSAGRSIKYIPHIPARVSL